MIRCEMKKYLSNYTIYVAILVVTVLMLAGTIYTSIEDGKEYSVFDLMKKQNRDAVFEDNVISVDDKLITETESYIWMFAPIVAAIPFTMLICGERKNSLARFELYRVGKIRYRTGKFFAAILSGGVVLTVGYIFFSIILLFVFRGHSSEIDETFSVAYTMANNNKLCEILYKSMDFKGIYLIKLLSMFLYGMMSSILAYAISGVLRNRYMILCIPFIVNYFWIMFAEKNSNWIIRSLNPSNMRNFLDGYWYVLIVMLIVEMIAAMLFYRITMERRCDCGES